MSLLGWGSTSHLLSRAMGEGQANGPVQVGISNRGRQGGCSSAGRGLACGHVGYLSTDK